MKSQAELEHQPITFTIPFDFNNDQRLRDRVPVFRVVINTRTLRAWCFIGWRQAIPNIPFGRWW